MKIRSESTVSAKCRYFVPSSLLASQVAKGGKGASKKPKKLKPLTYSHLLEEQERAVQCGMLNKQTAANRATALRLFLRVHHFLPEDVIGAELRATFPLAEAQFGLAMQSEGRTSRSISNLRAALKPWRLAAAEEDKRRALEEVGMAPFGRQIRELIDGMPIRLFARKVGLRPHLLYCWVKGVQPAPSSVPDIRRIEAYFGMERDVLVTMAGIREHGYIRPTVGTPPPNAYRQRLAVVRKLRYVLKVPENSPLRNEWRELIRYKTAPVPALKRQTRGTWTFSPHQRVERDVAWYSFLDEKEVPSAGLCWGVVASYLGWMRLSTEDGGLGMDEGSVQTLGWLAVSEHLEAYLDWRVRRTDGKMTQGILYIIIMMHWMTRPGDGYLFQKPQFQNSLPERYRGDDWKQVCQSHYEFCLRLYDFWKPKAQIGRSSFDAVRTTIDSDEPMQEIADMVQRMKADRPIGDPLREAVWARDVFLIKLLASNPLRMRNIITLTWNEENVNGHRPNDRAAIYRRVDGAWWLSVPKHLFKNRGTSISDYDSPIQATVWPDLERYLLKYRTQLLHWPTDLVFLTVIRPHKTELTVHGRVRKQVAETEHLPYRNMGNHVAKLTERYLRNSGGSRMHAFRNVVATSILKANGGDIKTAALVLHDKQTTVEKHYAWLQSGDGNRRMGELLQSSFDRM